MLRIRHESHHYARLDAPYPTLAEASPGVSPYRGRFGPRRITPRPVARITSSVPARGFMAFSHLIDHLLDDPGVADAITALERQSIVVSSLPLLEIFALVVDELCMTSWPVL